MVEQIRNVFKSGTGYESTALRYSNARMKGMDILHHSHLARHHCCLFALPALLPQVWLMIIDWLPKVTMYNRRHARSAPS